MECSLIIPRCNSMNSEIKVKDQYRGNTTSRIQKPRYLATGSGKANSAIAHIELCVESTNENVAQDPQRAGWSRNIQSYETTQADCLTHLRYLELPASLIIKPCFS